eukprot:gene42458-51868_t
MLASVLLHKVYLLMRSPLIIRLAAAFLPKNKKIPSGLQSLPPYERVSESVYRISGQNPGYHTLQGTNIYLIFDEASQEALLVDTGEEWAADL